MHTQTHAKRGCSLHKSFQCNECPLEEHNFLYPYWLHSDRFSQTQGAWNMRKRLRKSRPVLYNDNSLYLYVRVLFPEQRLRCRYTVNDKFTHRRHIMSETYICPCLVIGNITVTKFNACENYLRINILISLSRPPQTQLPFRVGKHLDELNTSITSA